MHLPPFPIDEQERLEALSNYRILDTDPEPQFDRVASFARRRFDVPIALVAFMDADRNFLKARGEFPLSSAPRQISFCAHTILDGGVTAVLDASKDPRFADNPLVCGEFRIRFYAGAPLVTPAGYRIGTVCIFDTKPRESFSEADKQDLKELAAIATDHLEMRLVVGHVHDEIKARRAAETEARRIARHDALTGLPNRVCVQEVMAHGLPFTPTAALAADIDNFKTVNDALGHHAGDELLRRTGRIIRDAVGSDDFVARISGDEFVALLGGEDRNAVQAIAERLVRETNVPFSLAGHTISNGISIGVAFGDSPSASAETLLKNADLALCEAKRSGRKAPVVFDRQMAVETSRRGRLVRDLASALDEESIDVYFQPIHEAPNGRMLGVEALARWTHPEYGPISPVEFIVLAEQSDQILDLGEYILRSALEQARGWENLYVSVNLSPIQFKLVDLASEVADVLRETDFPAARLQLEVTEGVLLDDFDTATAQILALQRIGARVALDDFGTGYSSLSYLANLPFDKIKIDRSFVKGASRDFKRQAIIRHIVALAREFNMRVTAEGIETEEDAILLTAIGCTSLQGHYFGRAVPASEIGQQPGLNRSAA